jgi:hypothetical protein
MGEQEYARFFPVESRERNQNRSKLEHELAELSMYELVGGSRQIRKTKSFKLAFVHPVCDPLFQPSRIGSLLSSSFMLW